MNKTKVILVIALIIISLGSYTMYARAYWDGYAYEVTITDQPEPELTIQITDQELTDYPARTRVRS